MNDESQTMTVQEESTTMISGALLQKKMLEEAEREERLADEPFGPEQATTDADYISHFEVLDLRPGDTYVDTDGVAGDVVGVVQAQGGLYCEEMDRDTVMLVHIDFPEEHGGRAVYDDWQIGWDASRGKIDTLRGNDE